MVIAHPDDEGLSGGTLARLVDEGHTVTVVCATRGEVGEIADPSIATPETLGEVREGELRAAMAVLGIDDVRFLDYRDSGMAGTPENEDPEALVQAEPLGVSMELTALMQEVNPDAIITWDASGGYGHPDHIRVHEAATDAFGSYTMRSGRNARLYFMAIPIHLFAEMSEELRAQGIQPPNASMRTRLESLKRPPVTTEIDVTPYVERKREALARHRSQQAVMLPVDKLSDDTRRRFIATEYFHRAVPPVGEGEPVERWLMLE
jgi:LmbE family N-acetylglucosaminyl deacetylase